MEISKEQIIDAMHRFDNGERPPNSGEPRNSFVLDENGNEYPTKIIYALASGRRPQEFTTKEAESWLRKCDFECIKKDIINQFDDIVIDFVKQAKSGNSDAKKHYPKRLDEFKVDANFGNISWLAILGREQEPWNGIYPAFYYYKKQDALFFVLGKSQRNTAKLSWRNMTAGLQMAKDFPDFEKSLSGYMDAVLERFPLASESIDSEEARSRINDSLEDALDRYRKVLSSSSDVAKRKKTDSIQIPPLNQILYGPPGTGKTYSSILYAVSIIEEKTLSAIEDEAKEPEGYDAVFARYLKY